MTNALVHVHADRVGSPAMTLLVQGRTKNAASRNSPKTSTKSFDRAVALLRFTNRKLAAVLQARLAESELQVVQRRLRVLEAENARLRRTSRRRKPRISDVAKSLCSNGHNMRVVREMVSYVEQNYHRPIALGDIAAALKMNAAYLCHMFSRSLGVTFHRYLTEWRMEKAKELLREPHRRVCEVACAVGYASADQFRHAFKAHFGVPPSLWE